jgi:hypothetical protein
MIYTELVETVRKLPYEQRVSLIEVLAHSLKSEGPVERKRPSSLARVRGMLKVDGPIPTDEELEEAYTDYLIEKYK